ncbi:TIGR04222 domain-containing membrane protein [Yinghuangia soli]|uniref:TIGR04222 domain-containing membrane protein n=1 Tax=Yinghuangia soli TaxID=2908204 RepID=A0AA41U030_9ACTN|nr:TIGR04222 domain-containing membrane protein [Yinghuangia soli]MCF2528136.1 TIGR04222 domain-containing membrane protein [Yinghuangia soli]
MVLAAAVYFAALAVLAAVVCGKRRRLLAGPGDGPEVRPMGLLETALLHGGRRRAAEAVVAELYEQGDLDCAYNGCLSVRGDLQPDGPAQSAVLEALHGRRAAPFPELARALGRTPTVRAAEDRLVRGGLLTPRRQVARMRACAVGAGALAFAGGAAVFGIAATAVSAGIPYHAVPLGLLSALLPLMSGLAALTGSVFYGYVRLPADLRLTALGRGTLGDPAPPKRLGMLIAREGHTELPDGTLRDALRPEPARAAAWHHRHRVRVTLRA